MLNFYGTWRHLSRHQQTQDFSRHGSDGRNALVCLPPVSHRAPSGTPEAAPARWGQTGPGGRSKHTFFWNQISFSFTGIFFFLGK